MAKSLLRIKSRELRREGKSIKEIASLIGVSKGTVSLWCRDIELTKAQIENLINKQEGGLRRGQINAALAKKRLREEKIEKYNKEGIVRMANLSEKERFVAGLALYLAEGAKKERKVKFINSDPQIIKFMIDWFVKFFQLPRERFIFSIIINEMHRDRERVVKDFWSRYLCVPPSQFRKSCFVKTKQNKIYENYKNYYGTINFRVLQSADLFYKIQGLLIALLNINIRPA